MKSLAHIQAVTFDAGGTLIKPWPSVGHVYADVAARNGVKGVSADVLNRQFRSAWSELKNFNHGREEWSALVDRTFAGLDVQPPSGTFFPELYDEFREPETWRIFPDVLPTLNTLAAMGLDLGIVSNWDDRLLPLLERLGLGKYFQAIIVSCDVGFAKPSPVIFEHAAKKMGFAPEVMLHVGDSFDHDVAGAQSAGLEALLLERGADGAETGQIRSLEELEGMWTDWSQFDIAGCWQIFADEFFQ